MLFTTILALFAAAASAAPAQEGAESSKVNKRFIGGRCGVHVHAFSGTNDKGKHEMNVWVYDGQGMQIWEKQSIWSDGTCVAKSEGLPKQLIVNSLGSGACFEYGDDHWCAPGPGEEDDRCKTGDVDYPSTQTDTSTVDLDCGFAC